VNIKNRQSIISNMSVQSGKFINNLYDKLETKEFIDKLYKEKTKEYIDKFYSLYKPRN